MMIGVRNGLLPGEAGRSLPREPFLKDYDVRRHLGVGILSEGRIRQADGGDQIGLF